MTQFCPDPPQVWNFTLFFFWGKPSLSKSRLMRCFQNFKTSSKFLPKIRISIVKWTCSEGFIAIGDMSVIYIVPNVPWVSERLIILYYVSLIKFSKSKRSHGSIRSNRSTIWANRQINRRRSNRQTRSNRSNRSTRISKSSRAF